MIGDSFVVASTPELARDVAAMRAEPAPEAATRLEVDVTQLVKQALAEVGDDENLLIARYLLGRLEASASAEDGDVVAAAELLWAPEPPG